MTRSEKACAAFHARVAELGGIVLEPAWLGNNRPHHVRCRNGHDCYPRPTHTSRGVGICKTCAGLDPATAWTEFRSRVAEQGGAVLEPLWLGARQPHWVRCVNKHDCWPSPTHVRSGTGICRVCAGRDSDAAYADFKRRVTKLGGSVLEPIWLGSQQSHRVRCAANHECSPRPDSVQQGQGLCHTCANKEWDVFYVVANRSAHRVKFGITSGSPRQRLTYHAKANYTEIVRLQNAPDAKELERATLNTLALANIPPIKGREYFDLSALPLVLDVIDNWAIPIAIAA